MRARATWRNALLAESDTFELVEGNVYFPPASVRREFLRESAHQSVCPWKGAASYFDVVVEGVANENAAWTYRDPKPAARNIRDAIAFWKGVTVEQLPA